MFVYGNEKPSLPPLSFPTGGAPVWLTTVGKDLREGCLIATLADKSTLFSAGRGATHTTPSGGVNPVYAQANEDRILFVANYHGPDDTKISDGASVATFKIGEDCSLTLADVKNHSGSSVDPARQGGAHVHSVVPGRGGLAYACDLGMDKIFTYKVSREGKLTELARNSVKPGAGPRHLVEHPSLPYVYVVFEMGTAVASYKQQPKGALELIQTESVVDKKLGDGTGSKAAEIAISPDGSCIFATNRGSQNTVTVFKTLNDGKLDRLSSIEAPKFPRGMSLIADGSMLVVGGQSQTEVWSYAVGKECELKRLSELHPTGGQLDIPPHPSTFTSFSAYSPEPVVV
jgi:6-phosphogluconolactonase